MNKFAGEKEIELGGKKFVLRPDFRALIAIEDELGHGILDLLLKATSWKLRDLTCIVHCLIESGMEEDAPRREEVGAWILETGFQNCVLDALRVLNEVVGKKKKVAGKK